VTSPDLPEVWHGSARQSGRYPQAPQRRGESLTLEDMFDSRDRFRVESPKGPYVGYGVADTDGGRWLTAVDLPGSEAMIVVGMLMVAAADRDLRGDRIRVVSPPRPITLPDGPAGLLSVWAVGSVGWMGYVLVDGAMRANWVPASLLKSGHPAP
jgi:hypothetical protein